MSGLIAGFLLGLSLILAIGAQNAFILKQGLRREHVFVLCAICAISDAILITFGVFGFALVASKLPLIEPFARFGGALFLFIYGAKSFWAAWCSSATLAASDTSANSLTSAVLTCLAFTWLNPHVYLDTFVLLGSISTQYSQEKNQFALGAASASVFFFFSLGYGARLLAPIFQKAIAWKILEVVIGVVMWTIALSLVWQPLLKLFH